MTLVPRGMKTQHEYAVSEPVEHFGSASGVAMFYGDSTVMFNAKKLVQESCFLQVQENILWQNWNLK